MLQFCFSASLPSSFTENCRFREPEGASPTQRSFSGSKCLSRKFWVSLSGMYARCPPLSSHQSSALWKWSCWPTNSKQEPWNALWPCGHSAVTPTSFSTEGWKWSVNRNSMCRTAQHILSIFTLKIYFRLPAFFLQLFGRLRSSSLLLWFFHPCDTLPLNGLDEHLLHTFSWFLSLCNVQSHSKTNECLSFEHTQEQKNTNRAGSIDIL